MEYYESNFFNTTCIVPFHEKRPFYLCGKEDMFSFRRLELIFNAPKYWTLYMHEGHVFYSLWVPDTFKTTIKFGAVYQIGFYVLTQTPSIFDTCHDLKENQKLYNAKWLLQHWNTTFLVTVPLLKFIPKVGDNDVQIDYIIPNYFPLRKVTIEPDGEDQLEVMLTNRAYTMLNGFSLFIELNKSQHITDDVCMDAIRKLFRARGHSLYHEVELAWQELYYGHPNMHVSDNPWFLANMGKRPVSLKVMNLLAPIDDDIIMNMPFGATHTLTTIKTTMLAHLDPVRWEMMKGPRWYDSPMVLNDGDRYFPNLMDFFIGITRTRGAWKWWLKNCEEYLEELYDSMANGLNRIQIVEHFLTCALHLYTHGKEYRPRLCYSRIRTLWHQIMKHLDPNCQCVHRLIQRWGLKLSFCHTLKVKEMVYHEGWEFQPPFVFLRDVVEMYGEKCRFFDKIHMRVYSSMQPSILKHYSDLERVENTHGGSYLLSKYTTIQIMRMMPRNSTYYQFYLHYLKARMHSRFQAIYQGFGMLEGKDSTAYPHVPGIHTVGFLVMDYLSKNKDLMYA